MIREAFQDLNRLRQIAQIAARHGFGELADRSGIWSKVGKAEPVEVAEEARQASAARRFRMLLNDLGPTFIKLGQTLSTRADLLPARFIEELAHLQDNVPPFPIEEVHQQIRRELGADVSTLFEYIDPKPLAAASIAQVHRARTLTGDEVVIKVQRPGITETIRGDLSVLHYLGRLLEAVIEESGVYTPTGIVEEFDRAIHEELDFLHEAANVRAFHQNHRERKFLRIPRVYDGLSSRRVLTLEFLKGTKISQADLEKHDRRVLAHNILESSFLQLFEDGLFHGDPHPGNILVLDGETNTLALLDFGLVGRLTRQMQETLVTLCLAIALKDSDSVARILYRVGVPDGRTNLMSFRTDIESILGRYLPTTLGEVSARDMLRDLLDLAVKYRIRIPREYAILSRAAIATEGMLRSLWPDMNIAEVALPYAKKLLADRYDPSQFQGGLMRTLLRVQSLANDLPVQLSQVLMDLESGKFSVNVRSEQIDQMHQSIRSVAMIGFLGLCACGFIVGAFVSLAQTPAAGSGINVRGVVAIVAAAMLFGAVFTWYVFGGRVRKFRITRWLKRRRRSRG